MLQSIGACWAHLIMNVALILPTASVSHSLVGTHPEGVKSEKTWVHSMGPPPPTEPCSSLPWPRQGPSHLLWLKLQTECQIFPLESSRTIMICTLKTRPMARQVDAI